MNLVDWKRKVKIFIRWLFRWKTKRIRQPPIPFIHSPYLERIRTATMGKSLKRGSRRHPEERVAFVNNFVDAYRHLLRIGDQQQLSRRYAAGHYYYIVTLPENYGQLILTDNVGFRRDGAIAVLKINVKDETLIVKVIRYKQTL